MKHFLLRHRLIALTLSLGCVVTVGLGQQFASARVRPDGLLLSPNFLAQTSNRSMRPLAKVLADLERNHQVIFDFDNNLVKSKVVNVAGLDMKSANLERVLLELLTPVNLSFEKFNSRSYLIYNRTNRPAGRSTNLHSTTEAAERNSMGDVAGLAAPTMLTASLADRVVMYQVVDRLVTGEVRDAGNPLPGVNVLVKGTGIGTTTDANGKFKLNVPDTRNVLVFSYIGYLTQEVTITGNNTVTVNLLVDNKSLEEVVVVGYGTQKRSDLTGAVSSVKSEEIKNLPATDLNTALQGRVPGALVQQTSGEPGANSNIIIRGPVSINGGSPLYVIDGVPQGNPGYNFNLQDIESIEVLKDAASAAIYGAQAGGGVILVTTKKGKAGKIQVGFSTNYGVRDALNLPTLLSRDQYIPAKEAFGFDPVDLYGPRTGWNKLPDTDWLGATYRQGAEQNYQLSLAGGNEKSHFYVSGNYNKIEGTRIGNWLEKYSFRLNSDHQISKRFKFTQTFQATYRNGSANENTNQGPVSFRNTPVMPIYDATNPLGGWGKAPKGFQGGNDVQAAIGNYRNLNGYEFYTSGSLDYEVIDGLTARALLGTKLYTDQGYRYQPPYDVGTSLSNVDATNAGLSRRQNYVATFTLNYKKAIGQHNLSVLAGYEARRENDIGLGFFNTNALVAYPQNAGLFNNTNTAAVGWGQGDVYGRILSQFARAEYNFADRYLLTVNVRRDGYASKFGPNNRFGVFPGVSAGWKISDESFMKDVTLVTNMKLRVGYGQLGNATQGDFAFVSNYSPGFSYDFGAGRQSGITLQPQLANPDIRWESVNTTNIGLDAGLLNNRLTVNLDYYYRLTNNMLYNVTLAPSAGLGGSVPANVGQLQNTGFEFAIDWRDKVGEFTYGVAANGAFNQNKLIALDPSLGSRAFLNSGSPGTEPYRDYFTSRSAPGLPIGQFYGLISDGIYATNIASGETRPTVGDITPRAGDLRFRDISGPDGKPDGKITDDDKTYIGNPWPKFNYGITLTAGYKGFDLRAFFSGVQGQQIYNAFESMTHLFFSDYNTTSAIYGTSFFNQNDKGQPIVAGVPNSGLTNVPRVGTVTDPEKNGNWSRVSSYHVQNGSYLRLRNLQIGYTFPRVLLDRVKINSLRVYVMGDNLLTFTGYKGINPDIPPRDGDVRQMNIDASSGRYPVSRLMSVGLSADF
ncbi:TonB-dependent receptor [Fibrella sp. HMF5335]|uniref:TonB-dependent receptor n=1 Tax=Fibrella rubiginis TaxID=2817060 RepID=A0A939GNP0_9BACT|nr:TonB-dependent receptor [Fibrella rubiginis]MBO0939797.1 TonB-dependent receptor [Fibrella rubiginis]